MIHPRDMMMGLRFFSRLPVVLRKRLTLAEASVVVAQRLERREECFLSNLRNSIFGYPGSPYLDLFGAAGCEYGDAEKLVHGEGVEGALKILFHHGIYISVDEFKGRRPAVRGGTTIKLDPDSLRNPCAAYHVPVASGGSRGGGTPVFMDLAFVRGCAINSLFYFNAWGGRNWRKATWEVPGAGARFRLIKYACFGSPPGRWFSQIDPGDPSLDPVFRLNSWGMHIASYFAGVPIPRPIHTPLSNPQPLLKWSQQVIREGGVPHIFTFPSSAVAACKAAMNSGGDLEGTRFTIGGEPITRARLDSVRSVGATALPRYGSMECGPIGYGCMKPVEVDEVHLLNDLHALIQAGPEGEVFGFPENGLLITALHPRSPFVLLNVSMGDEAVLSPRSCGCPLEELGWHVHLHTIRSYEKLTSGGITFFGSDVIHVLEVVLPERFGGGPTDYQLLEEEGPGGVAAVKLLVSPSVGDVDFEQVRTAFLESLAANSAVNQVMIRLWKESDVLTVERRNPQQTRSGKVLHFHIDQHRSFPT
jgi:hypothetical protein